MFYDQSATDLTLYDAANNAYLVLSPTTNAGSVSLGAAPASTGALRLSYGPNNGIFMTDQAGAGVLGLIEVEGVGGGSNRAYMGSLAGTGATTRIARWTIDFTDNVIFTRLGGARFVINNTDIRIVTAVNFCFDDGVVNPTICHEDDSTVGGTGDLFTLHSQDLVGGGASVGGSLDVRPGAGATGGQLALQTGDGTDRFTIADGGIDFPSNLAVTATGNPTFNFGTALSTFGGNVNITGKLTVTGAIDPSDISIDAGVGNNAFLDLADGQSAAVSAASHGRLRYDTTGHTLQVSLNTAAYVDVATSVSALPNCNYGQLGGTVQSVSATYATVLTFNLTTTETGRILANAAVQCSSSGAGTNVTAAYRITINAVNGPEMQRFLSGAPDAGLGAVMFRSGSLAAGTYAVTLEHRRVSGTKTLDTEQAQLWGMAVCP
jgi:hypothetical protein